MSSFTTLDELLNQTIKEFKEDSKKWESFLKTASQNYKRKFTDQVLIYAQKPNAIACLDLDTWNKDFHRWIVKGSKGIAIFTEINGYSMIEYVFDYNDTFNKNNMELHFWEVKEKYIDDVIKLLEDTYGLLKEKDNIGLAIISSSSNLVNKNIEKYLEDFKGISEDIVKKILINSISYMTLNRCGFNPNNYLNNESIFNDIINFNYDDLFNLGIATSNMARMELEKIYQEIKNLQIKENDKIYTFDKNSLMDYYESIKKEGRNFYEKTDLQESRGLSNSEYKSESSEDKKLRKIQRDEIGILKEEQKQFISEIINSARTRRSLRANSDGIRKENTRTYEQTKHQKEYGRTNYYKKFNQNIKSNSSQVYEKDESR